MHEGASGENLRAKVPRNEMGLAYEAAACHEYVKRLRELGESGILGLSSLYAGDGGRSALHAAHMGASLQGCAAVSSVHPERQGRVMADKHFRSIHSET